MTRVTRVVCIGLVLAPIYGGQAQMAVGVGVGVTSSSVLWTGTGFTGSSNQNRNGYQGSAFLRVRDHRGIAIETGFRILPKGYERTTPTVHSTYVEVPARFVFQSGRPTSAIRPFGSLGIVLGRMVSCRRFFRGVSGFHEDGCVTVDDADVPLFSLRRWDLAMDLGFGIRVGGPDGRIFGAFHTSRSMVDIDPHRFPGESMLNIVHEFIVGVELYPSVGR